MTHGWLTQRTFRVMAIGSAPRADKSLPTDLDLPASDDGQTVTTYFCVTVSSVRRFWARPSSVSFDVIGRSCP